MAKYRVVGPTRARLVPGSIIDGATVDNVESLVRLGVVVPYTAPKKKKPAATKKAANK